MQFNWWHLTSEPGTPPLAWAKPWRSLGQALGGADPTSFLRRSRSPDHSGHDAHRSTGGPPASSLSDRFDCGLIVGACQLPFEKKKTADPAKCNAIPGTAQTSRGYVPTKSLQKSVSCCCFDIAAWPAQLFFSFLSVPTWAKPWRSLGQALGGDGPYFVSYAVTVAGPQRSRRPPLYWGSSHQQLRLVYFVLVASAPNDEVLAVTPHRASGLGSGYLT